MGRYTLRDGKFTATHVTGKTKVETQKELVVKNSGESKAVSYIKMQPVSVGTAGAPGGYVYLYIGSAGHLMFSTNAPTGTTGAFSDAGTRLGTAA